MPSILLISEWKSLGVSSIRDASPGLEPAVELEPSEKGFRVEQDASLSEILDELLIEGEFSSVSSGRSTRDAGRGIDPSGPSPREAESEIQGLSLAAGDRVGKYVVVSPLSRGGQGRVYLARDPDLDRQVALKLSHRPIDDDSSAAVRIQNEGFLLARIRHPNLAHVYDCGVHHGYPYLVMEYVQGRTLREHARLRSLSSDEIRRIVTDVAEALDAAHRGEILHLDLKPDNILVTPDGSCKLIDFGMGWLLSEQVSDRYRMIGGTWEYMSPEQRTGRVHEWSPATDVFGLGGILCFLLTRRAVLSRQAADEEECRTELDETIARVRESGGDRDLRWICVRSIAYSQSARLPDAGAFLRQLATRDRMRRLGRAAVFVGIVSCLLGTFLLFNRPDSIPDRNESGIVPVRRQVPSASRRSLVDLEIVTTGGREPLVYIWSPRCGARRIRGLERSATAADTVWRHPTGHPIDLSKAGDPVAIIVLDGATSVSGLEGVLTMALSETVRTLELPDRAFRWDVTVGNAVTDPSETSFSDSINERCTKLRAGLAVLAHSSHVRFFAVPEFRERWEHALMRTVFPGQRGANLLGSIPRREP